MSQHRDTFFMHNGPGPWLCGVCDVPIFFAELYEGSTARPVVHHLDLDHSNNAPSNLRLVHFSCHTRAHNTGKVGSWRGKKNPKHSAWMKAVIAAGRIDMAAMGRLGGGSLSGSARAESSRKGWETRRKNAQRRAHESLLLLACKDLY